MHAKKRAPFGGLGRVSINDTADYRVTTDQGL